MNLGTSETASGSIGSAAEAAPGRPSTREVAGGAALALVGALGVFFPIASVGLIAPLLGAGPGGVLDALARVATLIPVVCLLSLAAAVARYRDARWARALSILVVGLLVAALPVWFLATISLPMGDGGLAETVLWHLFLVIPHQPVGSAVAFVAGLVVAWSLLTRAGPARARGPARRPSFAMFLLILTGVESVAPYLSWLATNLLAPPVAANGGPPIHGPAAVAAAGILVAIPSAMASISALAAARAIRSRAPYGLYLAPAASAMAGPWSALWVVLIGVGSLGSTDEGSIAVRLALQAVVIILVGLSALAFFVVSATVLGRRDWFLDRAMAAQLTSGAARSRPGRFWTVAGGVMTASLLPLVVASAIAIVNPPPPPLYYNDVLFDGRAYRHAAPLDIAEAVLAPAGSLSAWTEDLQISVTRPDAFTFPSIPIERAIVVRGGIEGSELPFSVFVPSDGAQAVPSEVCRYIPIESAAILAAPCVPLSVSLAGTTYDIVGGGFVVVRGDLDPLEARVDVAEIPDPRVDLAANLVRGVPVTEAIALRAGERILIYMATGRYIGGELCRYSPLAVEDPLADEKEQGEASLPYGCLFPSDVVFEGRRYLRDSSYADILRVPTSALTPLGTAAALHPDFNVVEPGATVPFPATIDATAHRITGVDPETAIAFRVGDRVVVLVIRLEGAPLIPPALCPYVDPGVAAQWERDKGESPGCSAS